MRSKYYNSGGYYAPQGQWTPTKRRGPIAAEFITPGPASISLPQTFGPNARDSRKIRSPSFTFGSKHEEKLDTYRPGPGEYNVDGVTKNGKDWSFAAFMSPKLKDPEPFNTPAPGAYNVEKCLDAVKEQSPSYTFGFKPNEHKNDGTPSPCEYSIEKALNQVYLQQPCYSIGTRLNELSTDKTPGPGAYNVPKVEAYKVRSDPSFTFRYKTALPEDKTRKPSPTDYEIEKVWINKISPPRYTFGMRHSEYVSTLNI